MADWQNRIVGYRVVKASELAPNEHNWRKHPTRQKTALAQVLDKVGWVDTVLYNIRTGRLIDGHLRQSLDPNADVPVLDVDLSEEEERLILATLDPIGAMAKTDREVLGALLEGLQKDDEALADLLQVVARDNYMQLGLNDDVGDVAPQVDRAKDLQVEWQTARGQVWLVDGKHRVMCGDSTSGEDVAILMQGAKADLLVTDPPYGVNYDPQWRKAYHDLHGHTARGKTIVNDDNFLWMEALTQSADYWDVGYVWVASWYAGFVQTVLEDAGYGLKYLIIWAKDEAIMGRGDYHWRHEPCLYVVKDGCKHNWQGARDQNTVWNIPTIHSFAMGANVAEGELTGHGNQKPIECMKRPIQNNSAVGQKVLDLFLGSGTTLIACAQTGRVCYGMEIAPEYVAVILQRAKDAGMNCEKIGW